MPPLSVQGFITEADLFRRLRRTSCCALVRKTKYTRGHLIMSAKNAEEMIKVSKPGFHRDSSNCQLRGFQQRARMIHANPLNFGQDAAIKLVSKCLFQKSTR